MPMGREQAQRRGGERQSAASRLPFVWGAWPRRTSGASRRHGKESRQAHGLGKGARGPHVAAGRSARRGQSSTNPAVLPVLPRGRRRAPGVEAARRLSLVAIRADAAGARGREAPSVRAPRGFCPAGAMVAALGASRTGSRSSAESQREKGRRSGPQRLIRRLGSPGPSGGAMAPSARTPHGQALLCVHCASRLRTHGHIKRVCGPRPAPYAPAFLYLYF